MAFESREGLADTLHDTVVGTGILSAFAVVALLVFIASCNVAAILLARASTPWPEHGVQITLGAARGRLIRQQILHVAITVIGHC